MPTDKTLKTINVFPDEDTYEENAGSLGEDELNLVPVTIVKSINGVSPDSNGNIKITVNGNPPDSSGNFSAGGTPNISKIMNIPSNPWKLTSMGECHMKRGSGGGGSISVNGKNPGIYPEDYSELSVVLKKGDSIGWGGLEYAKFIPWE